MVRHSCSTFWWPPLPHMPWMKARSMTTQRSSARSLSCQGLARPTSRRKSGSKPFVDRRQANLFVFVEAISIIAFEPSSSGAWPCPSWQQRGVARRPPAPDKVVPPRNQLSRQFTVTCRRAARCSILDNCSGPMSWHYWPLPPPLALQLPQQLQTRTCAASNSSEALLHGDSSDSPSNF